MKDFYVYVFISKTDNKTVRYVGKGRGTRMVVDTNRKYKVPLKNRKKVATGLTEQEAFNLERKLIRKHGRLDLGTGTLTNLTDGGDGAANPSPETRAKLSKARKGNTNARGFKHTEATKAKVAAASRGRSPSAATRKKIAAGNKGKTQTAACKAKLSAARKGKSLSQAHRDRISQGLLANEHTKKLRKTYIVTFPNGKEQTVTDMKSFCKEHGLPLSSMHCIARGEQKQSKGFTCRYA